LLCSDELGDRARGRRRRARRPGHGGAFRDRAWRRSVRASGRVGDHRRRRRHRTNRRQRSGSHGPTAGSGGTINTAMLITAAMIEGATLFAVVVALLGVIK